MVDYGKECVEKKQKQMQVRYQSVSFMSLNLPWSSQNLRMSEPVLT